MATTIAPYPKARRFLQAAIRTTHNKPMIHGLIEVDVTNSRAQLKEHQAKSGEALSFTAFVLACLAKAVDEDKAVQAFRLRRNRLLIFDDVDVLTWIERELGAQKAIIPYIVRAANRKTFLEIHSEIRAAQVQDMAKVGVGGARVLRAVPAFLFGPYFRVFSWIGRWYPKIWKRNWGTVGITALGMYGDGAGWGVPPTEPTLTVTVGGIGTKPGVIDGQIAIREYLSLTISFDHTMIDGAPAARFTERLKELVESGYGLTLDGEPIARPALRQRIQETVLAGGEAS